LGIFGRKKRNMGPSHLEGVITFFGSHHALRAEKVLRQGEFEAVLIPGPREISPNCGVALRFDYTLESEVGGLLAEKKVEIEAMHHYPDTMKV
jgi:hypothetical protein